MKAGEIKREHIVNSGDGGPMIHEPEQTVSVSSVPGGNRRYFRECFGKG